MVDLGRQFSDLAGAVERYGRVPMEGRVEEAKMGWEKTKWDTQEARRAIEEGRASERHTAFMGEAKEKERVRQDETLKREKMAKTPFNMGTSKLFDNVSIGSTELASRYMQILVKAVDPNAVFNPKSGQVEIYEKEGEVGEVPSKSRPASELEVNKALPIIIGAFGSVTDGLQVLKDAAARGNQKAINKLETLNTPEALKAYYEEMLATKQEIYNAVITSGKATPELANMMKSGLGHTIEKIKEYSNVINAETVRQRGIIDESIKQGRLQQQKIIFNDIALLDKQIAASQKILSQGYENQFGVLTPVDPNEKDTSGNPTVNAIMARANQKIIDTANIKKAALQKQLPGIWTQPGPAIPTKPPGGAGTAADISKKANYLATTINALVKTGEKIPQVLLDGVKSLAKMPGGQKALDDASQNIKGVSTEAIPGGPSEKKVTKYTGPKTIDAAIERISQIPIEQRGEKLSKALEIFKDDPKAIEKLRSFLPGVVFNGETIEGEVVRGPIVGQPGKKAEKQGYGKREDGTDKGDGWLGPLKRKDGSGKISSEISASFDIGGKEIFIPLMVPGLIDSELDYLLTVKIPFEKGGKIPRSIVDKAISHAIPLIKKGESPFAPEGYKPERQKQQAAISLPKAPKLDVPDISGPLREGVKRAQPLMADMGKELKPGISLPKIKVSSDKSKRINMALESFRIPERGPLAINKRFLDWTTKKLSDEESKKVVAELKSKGLSNQDIKDMDIPVDFAKILKNIDDPLKGTIIQKWFEMGPEIRKKAKSHIIALANHVGNNVSDAYKKAKEWFDRESAFMGETERETLKSIIDTIKASPEWFLQKNDTKRSRRGPPPSR